MKLSTVWAAMLVVSMPVVPAQEPSGARSSLIIEVKKDEWRESKNSPSVVSPEAPKGRQKELLGQQRETATRVHELLPSAPARSAPWVVPFGTTIPWRPGFVNSPFAAKNQLVDVTGLPVGMEVKCPYTGKLFMVPPGTSAQQVVQHLHLEQSMEQLRGSQGKLINQLSHTFDNQKLMLQIIASLDGVTQEIVRRMEEEKKEKPKQ